MIASLVFAAFLATPAPAAAIDASGPTTGEVKQICVSGAAGDARAEAECLKHIRAYADTMLVDPMLPGFKSNCLVLDPIEPNALIWAYLAWLRSHPDADAKPASTTINAALLEKLPCGWREAR